MNNKCLTSLIPARDAPKKSPDLDSPELSKNKYKIIYIRGIEIIILTIYSPIFEQMLFLNLGSDDRSHWTKTWGFDALWYFVKWICVLEKFNNSFKWELPLSLGLQQKLYHFRAERCSQRTPRVLGDIQGRQVRWCRHWKSMFVRTAKQNTNLKRFWNP